VNPVERHGDSWNTGRGGGGVGYGLMAPGPPGKHTRHGGKGTNTMTTTRTRGFTVDDLSDAERERIALAVHEAGHTVAGVLLGGALRCAVVGHSRAFGPQGLTSFDDPNGARQRSRMPVPGHKRGGPRVAGRPLPTCIGSSALRAALRRTVTPWC
jgi:hypothetical protein